jgi:hypothetical protein
VTDVRDEEARRPDNERAGALGFDVKNYEELAEVLEEVIKEGAVYGGHVVSGGQLVLISTEGASFVAHRVEVLTEDHVNPTGDGIEPMSTYEDDPDFSYPIALPEGTVMLAARRTTRDDVVNIFRARGAAEAKGSLPPIHDVHLSPRDSTMSRTRGWPQAGCGLTPDSYIRDPEGLEDGMNVEVRTRRGYYSCTVLRSDKTGRFVARGESVRCDLSYNDNLGRWVATELRFDDAHPHSARPLPSCPSEDDTFSVERMREAFRELDVDEHDVAHMLFKELGLRKQDLEIMARGFSPMQRGVRDTDDADDRESVKCRVHLSAFMASALLETFFP